VSLRQVFDGNTTSEKAFRFKVGKGKVIKVCVETVLSEEYHSYGTVLTGLGRGHDRDV
jgi:hypothetical protein